MKRQGRKLLSLLVTMTMIAAMSIGFSVTADAETYWDGTIPAANGSYAFSGGSGSVADPYQIATAADLAQLSANVAAGYYQSVNDSRTYFKLMNDIYLNSVSVAASSVNPSTAGTAGYTGTGTIHEWQPIGGANTNYSFQGYFDGNGKTIYNIFYNHSDGSYSSGKSLKNNAGLFGKLEEDATIINLKVSGGYFGGQRSIGGIVGKSWGSIISCHNLGTAVYSNQSKGVGGIVGANWVNTSSNPPTVKGCTNAGTVTSAYSSGSAGGIAGENEGQIYNCKNTGSITSPYNAGGLVGSNKNNYNKKTLTGGDIYGGVSNCYNTGSVSGKYAGGIIAYQIGTCVNCYNKGTITGSTYAGQLIGQLSSSSTFENNELHYWTGSTVNPFGNTTSATGADSFGTSSDDRLHLLDELNSWVNGQNSEDNQIYSSWIEGSDGYPAF